jgi:pilus assembly protein TadC
MLSKKEQEFIRYWEQNRLRRKKTVRQFLVGIPVGLLFVVPITISLTSGWYRRANMEANSQEFNPVVLLVALLFIVGFTAIFYQRHQWDQYEQRYRELLARQARETRQSALAASAALATSAAASAPDTAVSAPPSATDAPPSPETEGN